ncbi:transcriptional regulator [Pseudomonas sp. HMWF032]|uniref:ATP-binding protein n=1 Tax=Pseudomonas sp. HMWF032 TaxID=2056866 RepID=UPI000D3ADF6C|nr:winged helix-turn-helix domain-containing protein [Pseudomonas sp. HMWF032]PTS86010.1 transcriptional regulator [Pseudomonas sp. HMWF032]PTT83582.1 transcriptional regulator [Pseudomonas sp. HMWF010]
MNILRSSQAEEILHFGSFSFYVQRRLVLNGGRPLRVGSKALEILRILLLNAGEVVSKEAIIAHVWPATVVEEINLRVHIAALRRALGDGLDGKRYIVNVPLRGYTFVAAVQLHGAAADDPPSMVEDPRSTLPVRLSQITGRDAVVDVLVRQLPDQRLITLVAAGGMGKTVVALRAAELLVGCYEDGVVFIDIAALDDPALVAPQVAAVLNLSISEREPVDCIGDYLRPRRILLLLDNCEHLIGACAALVERLLKVAPRLSILATSREPLLAEGECVRRLMPLTVPAQSAHLSAADALTYSALQLFVSCVVAHQERFCLRDQDVPLVVAICRRLNGSPLAIELAATRVAGFGLEGLHAQLQSEFLLSMQGRRSALARQESLRASLDWSYVLLTPGEQLVLQRLALLKVAVTLDQAIKVIACKTLGRADIFDAVFQLVAKSLLLADMVDEVVYYRLFNCTRAYALGKLQESDEFHVVRERYARYLDMRRVKPNRVT